MNVVTPLITHVDVGPIRTKGVPRHIRMTHDVEKVGTESDLIFLGVERNLTRMTMHVPMTDVEDIPLHMKCHVTRVLRPSSWILK